LIVSIAVWSWLTGRWLDRQYGQRRKHALWLAITWPLLALLWFKYANLLAATADVSGWDNILLPIGLSFFVFGAISYSVDVYRGTCRAGGAVSSTTPPINRCSDIWWRARWCATMGSATLAGACL